MVASTALPLEGFGGRAVAAGDRADRYSQKLFRLVDGAWQHLVPSHSQTTGTADASFVYGNVGDFPLIWSHY